MMTPSDVRQESSDDSSDSSRLERRRAQSRTRQLRYLERKRQYERGLLASVDTLQSEQMLRCHRPQLLHSQPQVSSKPLVIWFTASARGLHRPKAIHGCHAPPPTQEQVRFVQQVVHPDVSNGELRGQNSFLEQWRRYTAFFGSLALHPQSFSMLPGNVGHAVCQTQLTLSLLLESSAFQHVFPHLLQPQHSTLLQRLSNQQLHVPMTLQLQFDALGRVCSYDASMNFVQALRPLLASYEDVAAVLHDALISPCGHIGRDVQRVRDVRLQVSFMLSPS
ncbi:hypothetical protein PR002_g9611 [Phytophthora rubi]|uniref:BZIP domain-containing protein n=1 Tax=Phytophthora rubi TaxID=129364 RepID=A0A6A3MQP4_9STRA|nr:hypothetical protein PR002_g9611 [Phytophthora rubi]